MSRRVKKKSKKYTKSYSLLDETIYLIMVSKIDVFFVLLKKELPNYSTSGNLESLRFKLLLWIGILGL